VERETLREAARVSNFCLVEDVKESNMDNRRSGFRRFGIAGLLMVALCIVAVGGSSQAGPVFTTLLPDGEILIDPTVTIKGTVTGTAAKGTYTRNGKTLTTSDKQLAATKKHAAEYNGATEFTANYTIVLNKDKSVDTSKSTVTFTTVNYTSGGNLVASGFQTLPITITGVNLINNDPTKIESFTFSSTNWYPPNATGAGGITNNGLSGSINLSTGATSIASSYNSKTNGSVYTYNTTGMIAAPEAKPDPDPTERGNPEIFSPAPAAPEPATWILMLTGFAGVVYHQRKTRWLSRYLGKADP
jgi:hypothetical protein